MALLADEDRLRVLAAVVLGSGSVEEITAVTQLDAGRVTRALGRLRSGGMVALDRGRFAARTDVLKAAAQAAAAEAAPAGEEEADPVLRAFMRDGRLTSIPASRAKRRVVLDRIAQVFEPGRRYPETSVNEAITAFHPDYATVRRYLVDEGFLEREAGFYWRTGGTFVVE